MVAATNPKLLGIVETVGFLGNNGSIDTMNTNNGNKNSDSTTLSLSDMESDLAKTHHPIQGMVLGRRAKDETPSRIPGKGWIDRDRSKGLVSIKVICFGEPVKSASIDLQRGSVDLSADQLEIEPGSVVCVDKAVTRMAPGRLAKVGFVFFPRNSIVELRDDLVQAQFEYKADSEIREQIKSDREKAEQQSKKQAEKDKKESEKKDSKKDEKKPAEEVKKDEKPATSESDKLKEEQARKEAEARALHEKAEKERLESERLARKAWIEEELAKAAVEAAKRAEQERLSKERQQAEQRLKETRDAELAMMADWTDEDVEANLKSEKPLRHPERKPGKVNGKAWEAWKRAECDADAKKV